MEEARWSLLHVAKEERRLSTLEGTRLEFMRHRAAKLGNLSPEER